MAKIKKMSTTSNAGEYAEKLDHSLIHCWWNVKRYSYSEKHFGSFLKKKTKTLNMQLQYDSAVASLGTYPRAAKTYVLTKICTRMFITRYWGDKHPCVLHWVNG